MGELGYNIPKLHKVVPDAFHGTDSVSAAEILSTGFKASTGESLFLGTGVYFFEASPAEAMRWAQRIIREKKVPAKPSVLQATVQLGRCFDLNALECRDLLRAAMNSSERRGQRVNDATAINLLAKIADTDNQPFDTVRGMYSGTGSTKRKIHERSNFFDHNQLIICVRNRDNISETRILE